MSIPRGRRGVVCLWAGLLVAGFGFLQNWVRVTALRALVDIAVDAFDSTVWPSPTVARTT